MRSAGDSILVRVQRPTDIPLESLHGQRDNLGRSMRLTVAKVVPADSLGEFSLEAQQGEVAAVFVPLARLQQDLEISGRVNTLLVSTGLSPPPDAAGALRALVRRNAQLEDLGYSVETLEPTGVLSRRLRRRPSRRGTRESGNQRARRNRDAGERAVHVSGEQPPRRRSRSPVFTRHRARPGRDSTASQPAQSNDSRASIVLNDWAATELQGSRRRHGHDGVLRVGGARSSGHKDDDVERGRRRADRSRRPEDGADVPGHHRFAYAGRLGSALPGGPAPDPQSRRTVLGEVSNDTEGVCRRCRRDNNSGRHDTDR